MQVGFVALMYHISCIMRPLKLSLMSITKIINFLILQFYIETSENDNLSKFNDCKATFSHSVNCVSYFYENCKNNLSTMCRYLG